MYTKNEKYAPVILFSVLYGVFFLLSAVNVPGVGKYDRLHCDILLCLSCIAPLYCSQKSTAVLTLIFGFLTDISVTHPSHLSPVLFLLCAVCVPRLISGFSRINAAVIAVCSLPLLLCRSFTGLVYLMNKYSGVGFFELVKGTVLPELVLNFSGVVIVYFVVRAFARFFRIRFSKGNEF